MSGLLKNLLWVCRRPQYFPEFIRKVRYRFQLSAEIKDSNEARSELEKVALDSSQALKQLFDQWSERCFEDECALEIKQANERIAKNSDTLGGAAALGLLYNCVSAVKSQSVIETGVAYGWSSLAILKAMEENSSGRLTSIDFPQLGSSGSAVGLAVPDSLKERWSLLVGSDRTKLEQALQEFGTIDLCHYDSDKSIEGRRFAYPLLWEALTPGGLFMSDDIGDNLEFLNFAKLVDREPVIVAVDEQSDHRKYIGILKK